MTADLLVKAIDESELQKNSENLTQRFIKSLKAASKHVQDKTPHPESFYVDIFTSAIQMISHKSQDKDSLIDLL